MEISWHGSPWEAHGLTPQQWFNVNFGLFIVPPDVIKQRAVPWESAPEAFPGGGVYFLVDDDTGEIAYVGITYGIGNRIYAHRKDKQFTRVYAFAFTQVFAEELEEFYIAALNPTLNWRARGVRENAAIKALEQVKSGELWQGWKIPQWEYTVAD